MLNDVAEGVECSVDYLVAWQRDNLLHRIPTRIVRSTDLLATVRYTEGHCVTERRHAEKSCKFKCVCHVFRYVCS